MSDDRPDHRSDELLVASIERGDTGAFEALYARYRDWVMALAWRFTQHEEDAHDVVQETFIYLLGKFPGFRLEARLTTFLYPAVKHIAIRVRDKRRRLDTTGELSPVAGAVREASGVGEDGDLVHVLSSLSDDHREVILLRFVDELPLEEIAGALGIPLGTVKSRLHHAIGALRRDPRVRDYFGE